MTTLSVHTNGSCGKRRGRKPPAGKAAKADQFVGSSDRSTAVAARCPAGADQSPKVWQAIEDGVTRLVGCRPVVAVPSDRASLATADGGVGGRGKQWRAGLRVAGAAAGDVVAQRPSGGKPVDTSKRGRRPLAPSGTDGVSSRSSCRPAPRLRGAACPSSPRPRSSRPGWRRRCRPGSAVRTVVCSRCRQCCRRRRRWAAAS